MVWAPSSHMAWVATSPRRTHSLARNSNCARAWRRVSFGTTALFSPGADPGALNPGLAVEPEASRLGFRARVGGCNAELADPVKCRSKLLPLGLERLDPLLQLLVFVRGRDADRRKFVLA